MVTNNDKLHKLTQMICSLHLLSSTFEVSNGLSPLTVEGSNMPNSGVIQSHSPISWCSDWQRVRQGAPLIIITVIFELKRRWGERWKRGITLILLLPSGKEVKLTVAALFWAVYIQHFGEPVHSCQPYMRLVLYHLGQTSPLNLTKCIFFLLFIS